MSQPKTIIYSLGVPSSNNLFSENVFFLGTGSSFDSRLIDTYIVSGIEASFLFIMARQIKKTLIMLSKERSPLPNDVVGTSAAISLADAKGMSGSTYTAAGSLGCIGLDEMLRSQLPTSMILFERAHTILLSPQMTAGFAEAPNVSLKNVRFRAVDQYRVYGRGGSVCHSSIHIREVIFTDENAFFWELPSKSDYKVDGTRKTESVDHFWEGCHITSAVHRSVFACDREG